MAKQHAPKVGAARPQCGLAARVIYIMCKWPAATKRLKGVATPRLFIPARGSLLWRGCGCFASSAAVLAASPPALS